MIEFNSMVSDHQFYNSFQHIADAQQENMSKIPELLALIEKYPFKSKLGIARLHKHFDLLEKERIIWRRTGKNEYKS